MSETAKGTVSMTVEDPVDNTVKGMVNRTREGTVNKTAEGTTGMDMMTAENLTIINKAMTNRNPMSE